jgi:hypothetical protein
MTQCSPLKFKRYLEKDDTSIFKVEEQTKTGAKSACYLLYVDLYRTFQIAAVRTSNPT